MGYGYDFSWLDNILSNPDSYDASALRDAGAYGSTGYSSYVAPSVSDLSNYDWNSVLGQLPSGYSLMPTLTQNQDGSVSVSGTGMQSSSGLNSLLSGLGSFLGSGAGAATLMGGLLGSMSGQKQDGTMTTKQTPWEGQQPYLLDLFQRAQQAAGQPGTTPQADQILQRMMGYQSNPLSDRAQAVIESGLGQNPANTFGIGMRNQYQGQANPFIGQSINPGSNSFMGATNPYVGQNTTAGNNPLLGVDNPYLKASIDAASTDAMRNLNSQFAAADRGSGSFGNSGLGETYARTAAQTLGNIATNARMQDYQNQQGLYENALNRNLQNAQYNLTQNGALAGQDLSRNSGLAENMLNRNLQNSQYGLTQNGNWWNNDLTRNSGLAQQGIQNDLSQYNTGNSTLMNAAFNAPGFTSQGLNDLSNIYGVANQQYQNQWMPLKMYGGLVTGNYGNTQQTPYYSNPYANVLGGGLLGSQIYKSLFPTNTSSGS